MITQLPNEPYYEDTAVTERLEQPSILADVWPMLDIAVRLLICLASIYMGLVIAVHSTDGIAVLAALACGGVIYGLLGRS